LDEYTVIRDELLNRANNKYIKEDLDS